MNIASPSETQVDCELDRRIGLVAGDGQLPALLARSARERGHEIVCLALSPSAEALLRPHVAKVYQVAPGQLGRNSKLFLENKLRQVVFIGKIPKLKILSNLHKVDWTAIKELSKLPNFNDDTIQRAMGDFSESLGVKVLPQALFLRHLFPDYGVLTKRPPSAEEYADVDFGFKIAREISRLDIGQTVIVKRQMIMAIEAIEGTDATIRRAVTLARGPVVVVKVAKSNHDPRFDLPTVGLSTLQAMLGDKPGGTLAVAAHETFMVERQEMVQFADDHGIAMVAV